MKKMKKLLIPLGVLVLVAAGVAGYLLFFTKEAEAQEPTYFTYALNDYFLTNVKDSSSLLRTLITIEIEERDKEEQQAFLAENEPIIRDTVLFLLRSKTYAELRSINVQETLSGEIAAKLEQQLGVDYITGAYFIEYVVQ